MEFRPIPVSQADREYRELQRRVQEELFAYCGISMMEYLRVMLEKADERLRAARAQQASATRGTGGAFGKE